MSIYADLKTRYGIDTKEDMYYSAILGGKGAGLKLADVDPTQLMMGIEVEKEHTDNMYIALDIALDHLCEISDYYTRLEDMEKEAESETQPLVIGVEELFKTFNSED